MAQAKFDCVAAIAGPNLYYLTGLSFHLSERPTTGFFPLTGDPVIVDGSLEESKVVGGAPYPVRGCYYTDAGGPMTAYREAAQALRIKGHLRSESHQRNDAASDFADAFTFSRPQVEDPSLQPCRHGRGDHAINCIRDERHVAYWCCRTEHDGRAPA